MRVWRGFRRRVARGFTLVEILIVALALGIFAAIALPAYSDAMNTAKLNSLGQTVADVQAASDAYQAQMSAFPTYGQPTTCPDAYQIDPGATNAQGQTFEPYSLRPVPDSTPADFGLQASNGAEVYYGVAAGGVAFATQAAPTGNEWTSGVTRVYTQSSVHYQAPNGPYTSLQAACEGAAGLQITLVDNAVNNTVTPGGVITFSGTVTSGGQPVSGADVTLQVCGSYTGCSTYSGIVTNASGDYSYPYTTSSTDYQYYSATASTSG